MNFGPSDGEPGVNFPGIWTSGQGSSSNQAGSLHLHIRSSRTALSSLVHRGWRLLNSTVRRCPRCHHLSGFHCHSHHVRVARFRGATADALSVDLCISAEYESRSLRAPTPRGLGLWKKETRMHGEEHGGRREREGRCTPARAFCKPDSLLFPSLNNESLAVLDGTRCPTTLSSKLHANAVELPDSLRGVERQKLRAPLSIGRLSSTFFHNVNVRRLLARFNQNKHVKHQK